MIVQITFLLLTNVVPNSIRLVFCFDLKCPDRSQQQQRQRAFCKTLNPEYMCLKDLIRFRDKEVCDKTNDFQRPGYKIVWRGNLDGQVCNKTHYQPIRYYTSDGSNCIFQKSMCSDEGQITYQEASLVFDRGCRCDFQKGYAFVNKPKNPCYCIASEEDCSCYRKKCLHGFELSPDYTCVRKNNDYYIYRCPNYIPSYPPKGKENEKYHYQRQEPKQRNILPLAASILVLISLCLCSMMLIKEKYYIRYEHLDRLAEAADSNEQNSKKTKVLKDVENLLLVLNFLNKRMLLMKQRLDEDVEWRIQDLVQIILLITELIQSLLKDQQEIKDKKLILKATNVLGELMINRTHRKRRRTVNIYPQLSNVSAEFLESVSTLKPTKVAKEPFPDSQSEDSKIIKQILKHLGSFAENKEEKQEFDNSNNKEMWNQIKSHRTPPDSCLRNIPVFLYNGNS